MIKYLLMLLFFLTSFSKSWAGDSHMLQLSKKDGIDFIVENCNYELGKFVGSDVESIQIFSLDSGEFLYEVAVNLHTKFNKRVAGSIFKTYCKYSPQAYGLKWPSIHWSDGDLMRKAVASRWWTTPKEIIMDEDSGGRYGRMISWTKPFFGANFKGKISYVNSQFGDGQKTNSPEFFMMCPDNLQLTCVSLEFSENIRLSQKERLLITKRLSVIRFVQSGK